MARRKSTIIDGKIILDDTGGTIHDVLGRAGKGNPPSVVSGGEVITRENFDRPAPAHDMITNQTPIVKGATLRERLLDQEFELIASRFLVEFDSRQRSLEMDDNKLLIGGFPLPDDFTPDHIDLLFVIAGYYEVPPAGVHIPTNSPNRQQITDRLGGHVQRNSSLVLDHTPASYRKYVEELAKQGWDWICFHHRDFSWQLKPNDLLAGDCLYKFIENTFALLSGGYRD